LSFALSTFYHFFLYLSLFGHICISLSLTLFMFSSVSLSRRFITLIIYVFVFISICFFHFSNLVPQSFFFFVI